MGYSPQGHKESDMAEATGHAHVHTVTGWSVSWTLTGILPVALGQQMAAASQ